MHAINNSTKPWSLHHNPSRSPLPAGHCRASAGTAPFLGLLAGHRSSLLLGCIPSKAVTQRKSIELPFEIKYQVMDDYFKFN